MSRRKPLYKACRKCKALVPHDEQKCPVCSSTSFSEDWEGVVIILKVEESKSAHIMEVKKPGKYAIKVR